jgi:hypothetical protein
MMFPLVRDLAATGIPVRLTCGVLGFSAQAFYQWRAWPCSDRDWADAHLTNAIVDVHADDPEFGYRFIADELEAAGQRTSEGRVWRLCRAQRVWSTTTKKGRTGSGKPPGPAVHDDLVQRNFSASGLDEVWLTDITEHPTLEGTLYVCSIKDVCSNRIVGYSIDERMTAQLAVSALRSAIARRQPTARSSSTPIADRSSGPARSGPCSPPPGSKARWDESPPPATTPPWSPSTRCCRRTSSIASDGGPATNCATRSSTGSSTPTTVVAGNARSADSRLSSSRSPSPHRRASRQHDQVVTTAVNRSRGRPPTSEP